MKIAHIWEECYRADIYLLWPATPEQLSKFVRKKTGDADYDNTAEFGGRCVEHVDGKNGQMLFIALRNWKRRDNYDLATLAHECFHATEYILRHRGFEFTEATSETFAYLFDSIFRRSLEKLLK